MSKKTTKTKAPKVTKAAGKAKAKASPEATTQAAEATPTTDELTSAAAPEVPTQPAGLQIKKDAKGRFWAVAKDSGQPHRAKSLVLYRGLARAVRRESAAAVAHWWGVGPATVNKWRRALNVPRWNEGDLRLKVANGKVNLAAVDAMHAKARDPVRRAKIAAAKLGKPRPPEVIEALRRANLGKKLSAETRAKMSAAAKRRVARGIRPPLTGNAWSAAEDKLVRTLPVAAVAKRIGRTYDAVASRRWRLRVATRA